MLDKVVPPLSFWIKFLRAHSVPIMNAFGHFRNESIICFVKPVVGVLKNGTVFYKTDAH